MKVTQCQRIIDYINQFGSITTMDAFSELGCTRLGSRIHDLRKEGYIIHSKSETRKNRTNDII